MKILVTTFGLYKGSGWGRIFAEAKGLSELGHEVTMLCSSTEIKRIYKSFYEEGVRITCFSDIIPKRYLSTGYGFLSLLFKLVYCVFHAYDICLSNSHRDNSYYPCAVNRFFHRSKLVIEWWDNFKIKQDKIRPNHIMSRFLKQRDIKREITTKLQADGVVALASLTARRAKDIGISSKKIKIVRGGCDIMHIAYHPFPSKDIKAKYNITDDCLTFGLIGDGDLELDDIGVFLEVLIELKQTYNIKFLNYGRPFKNLLTKRPEFKELLFECGWIDYYSDTSVLSATDVFVLIKQDNTENQSGWPNKLGDYLACGRPVIINPYGELIPFIQEWNPGFILVENSKASIFKGITDICGGKYDLRKMGDLNHDIARSNTWYHRAQELNSFFDELK